MIIIFHTFPDSKETSSTELLDLLEKKVHKKKLNRGARWFPAPPPPPDYQVYHDDYLMGGKMQEAQDYPDYPGYGDYYSPY